jgi:hypothetical protein
VKNYFRWPSEWDERIWEVGDACHQWEVGDACHQVVSESLGAVIDNLEKAIDRTWAWIDAVRSKEIRYHDYLKSPWWRSARLQRLWIAGWRCEYPGCEVTTGLDVHHLTYANIGAEDVDRDLIALCRPHHYLTHGRGIGDHGAFS